MTGGSSKTLANTGRVPIVAASVAISSDGRLVAAGSFDGAGCFEGEIAAGGIAPNVRDLQSFGGGYSEHSYRW